MTRAEFRAAYREGESMKHYILKKGAAIRIDGYLPARVRRIFRYAGEQQVTAECFVTLRKAASLHGYRAGETLYIAAARAVPRDTIRVSRQHMGRLIWPSVRIHNDDVEIIADET